MVAIAPQREQQPAAPKPMRPAAGILVALLAMSSLAAALRSRAIPPTVDRLLRTGLEQRWDTLAMGESVARFGRALEGAPYLERSLEAPGPEICRVTTRGFDCVTFMEVSLNLARTLRRDLGGRAPAEPDLRDAVTHTRYRAGILDGYASRLHYTSDWIEDNVAKGVIEDVTPSLGGVRYPVDAGFMSEHPELYAPLRTDPQLVDEFRRIERRLRSTPRTYIPKERVAAIEPMLRTGDLIGITTSIAGLDYTHTGMIVRGEDGRARFLHASSSRKCVTLDDTISRYLEAGPRASTGITVVRPLDPRAPVK